MGLSSGASGPPAAPLPGWLGSAVQVTTQVGVPTVFAAVLLWFVLMKVGGALESIEKNEEDRTRIVAAMQDSFIAALDRQTERFERAIHDNIDANRQMIGQMHGGARPERREP